MLEPLGQLKINKLKVNASGFGIIEVLIAMAIVSVIALQMANLFQSMNSNANNLQGKVGSISLTTSLIQLIASDQNNTPTGCFSHLMTAQYGTYNPTTAQTPAGMPIGFVGFDGTQIFGADPTVPTATPVPLPAYNVSVNYLVFRQATGPVATNNGNLYTGTLYAGLLKSASNTQQVTGGRGLREVSVGSLSIVVDANNNITSCYSQPVGAIDACSSLGGTYVATANPPCQLPYPCGPGLVFMGYDASQNPICNSSASVGVLTCPAGHTVVSNGTGYVCN